MSKELDDLLALVSTPEDKVALQAILDRNKATLATRLETSTAVYDAFVAGDDSAIDKAAKEATARAAAAAAAATNQAGNKGLDLDLEKLGTLVDSRAETRIKSYVESPAFVDSQRALAKAVAEELSKEFGKNILTSAARTSDEIYQVRRSHEKEFGIELDTPKFTEYLKANEGKFADLSKAHDAYVADDRIKAQIADGVKKELAERDKKVIEVPGTTLPAAESPLGAMIRANKTPGETARGVGIDAAVKSFRELQSKHATAN